MFTLDFLAIVEQEGLVSGQFLLNRLHWYLIDSLADLKRIHRL